MEAIQSNIIDFSKIIGHLELKGKILDVLSSGLKDDPVREAYLKSIDFHSIRGIMIYSPPGLGKTETLRAIERSLKDHPLIEAKYHQCSEFQGTTGKNSKLIENVFELARSTKKKTYVMLLDEIDSIFMKKRGMLNVAERTNALLSEMDGMKDSSKIVIIATTNRIGNIEEAMMSRFRDLVQLQPPNEEERKEFILKYISPIIYDKQFDMNIMVRDTEGYTGRNFKDIGMKMIDIYSRTNKPVSLQSLLVEVGKYRNRAGLIKNNIETEKGE